MAESSLVAPHLIHRGRVSPLNPELSKTVSTAVSIFRAQVSYHVHLAFMRVLQLQTLVLTLHSEHCIRAILSGPANVYLKCKVQKGYVKCLTNVELSWALELPVQHSQATPDACCLHTAGTWDSDKIHFQGLTMPIWQVGAATTSSEGGESNPWLIINLHSFEIPLFPYVIFS